MVQPDGKQLQQFASVVLVRLVECCKRLAVVDHVKITSHRRIERYLSEYRLKIAECQTEQKVLIFGIGISQIVTCARYNQNLLQCKSNTLPQLICSVNGILEELKLQLEQAVVVALTD